MKPDKMQSRISMISMRGRNLVETYDIRINMHHYVILKGIHQSAKYRT